MMEEELFEKCLPHLADGVEVDAYDLSQTKLNDEDIVVGEIKRRKAVIPPFKVNPTHVINLALSLYGKHASLIVKGFRGDLYDNRLGWGSDVYWGDGGLDCPLTEVQIGNLKAQQGLEKHLWEARAHSDPIKVSLSESNQKWLEVILGKNNKKNLGIFLGKILWALNRAVGLDKGGYTSVYVNQEETPRTLFELNGGAN